MRLLAALAFGSALLLGVPQVAHAQKAGADETAALARGDAATRTKKWSDAADAFAAAYALNKTERALFGLANAEYELGRDAEAYGHYEEYLNTFGAKAPPAKKVQIDKRLQDLNTKTGLLTVNVNVEGAEILVDDKVVGKSPLGRNLRLAAGPHRVRVQKADLAPFDRAPNVPAGGVTPLTVTLEAAATKGHLVVKEASGQAVHVLLDGVDVGPAPWEGEVDPGTHEIALRGLGLLAEAEKVEIPRGVRREFTLTANGGPATVRVAVADGQGSIFIDGKNVGEGSTTQTLAPGPHELKVTRDGYDPYVKTLTLKPKESFTESVTLQLSKTISTERIATKTRGLEGIYGGAQLGGAISASTLGSTIDTRCSAQDGLGAKSCDSSTPLGPTVAGYFGYQWDPVGLELFVSAQYDYTKQTVTFDGIGDSTSNKLAVGVARNETFAFHRIGGTGAVRARLVLQTARIRGALAGGVGLAFRRIVMIRDAAATDGSERIDKYSPASRGYFSPVLSIDGSVGYRTGETFLVKLGMNLSAESATALSDSATRVDSDPNRFMGKDGKPPTPIATPAYQFASGAQVFVGAYVGVEFGP